MQLIFLLLHGRRGPHSVLEHAHHLTRLRHVRLLGIERQQVFRNVLKVILQDLSPFVPQAKFFHIILRQGGQVDCPVSHRLAKRLLQLCLVGFVRRRDRFQISREVLLVIEEQVREFLQ